MSVTGEDIVAAHGHIACGIREPRTAGNSEPAGNSRFPLHILDRLLVPLCVDGGVVTAFLACALSV
jgi:hypothetical protein